MDPTLDCSGSPSSRIESAHKENIAKEGERCGHKGSNLSGRREVPGSDYVADASAGGGGRRRDCVVMMDGVVSAGQVGDVQELMGSIDTLSVKERQMSLKKSHQKWKRQT